MNLSGKRILIVKPSSLGDVVHTLPLVHALKRNQPDCHIGWIVQKDFMGLLESDPSVDELFPVLIPSTSDPSAPWTTVLWAAVATARTWAILRKKFRGRPYDIVLDLHASFRSGLLGRTNPGGIRLGFADAKELNTFFQNDLVQTSEGQPHAVDKNLAFANHFACAAIPQDFRITLGRAARASAQSFLKESGIGPQEKIIYANPVARWKTKLWTLQAWAELADLIDDRGDYRIVFGGGPSDLPYIQTIAARTKKNPLVSAGRLNLAASAALIEASCVYVGVDSGPMHIAAFVGTPVIAMFGPTDPAKVGPYGSRHTVLRNETVHCLACRKRSCADRRCLEEISPEQVFRAVQDRISSSLQSLGNS